MQLKRNQHIHVLGLSILLIRFELSTFQLQLAKKIVIVIAWCLRPFPTPVFRRVFAGYRYAVIQQWARSVVIAYYPLLLYNS